MKLSIYYNNKFQEFAILLQYKAEIINIMHL